VIGSVSGVDRKTVFIIRDMPVGRYDILVRFVGYEPVLIKELLLLTVKEAYLEIRMTENTNALIEIVITPKVNKL
jgi:hypothetical protein